MPRLSFLVVLAAVLANVFAIVPAEQQEIVQGVSSFSDNWRWETCGNPTDPIHIQSIEVSPDPPEKGADLTVTVRGVADKAVEEGAYADVTVKVGAIKLLHKEFDVCEEARNANVDLACPVTEGDHQVIHTVTLPKEIPAALFSVNVQGYTVDDEDLLCLNLWIDFRKKFFSW
ncbi:ML domain-containing protein [Sparassis latifolia]